MPSAAPISAFGPFRSVVATLEGTVNDRFKTFRRGVSGVEGAVVDIFANAPSCARP